MLPIALDVVFVRNIGLCAVVDWDPTWVEDLLSGLRPAVFACLLWGVVDGELPEGAWVEVGLVVVAVLAVTAGPRWRTGRAVPEGRLGVEEDMKAAGVGSRLCRGSQ